MQNSVVRKQKRATENSHRIESTIKNSKVLGHIHAEKEQDRMKGSKSSRKVACNNLLGIKRWENESLNRQESS
jgi:hypothetical protein